MPVGRIFASREAAAGCRRQQKGGIAAGKMPRSGRIVAQQQEKCAKGGERSTRSVPSRQGHCHKAAKGFKFVCAQLLFLCAASRFAKPRRSLKKVLIVAVRKCHCGGLNRGWQNLGASQKGNGFILFALCKKNQKAHQRFANLWTPGTIQSSAGSEFAIISGGSCRNRFCPQNGGEKALNRCERVTVVQTQDCCFSKKSCFTASSQ